MTASATPDLREAVAAVEAAMASCEADGHKCACRQFGWQFDAEAHQCSARLSGARSALGPDGPLAFVMRERNEGTREAVAIRRVLTEYRQLTDIRRVAWSTDPQVKHEERALRAAEAELATLKAAAYRDGEAARQEIAGLRAALDGLLPSKLCGESWGCPDAERVPIVVSFGGLRRARAALTTTETCDSLDQTEGGR